MRNAEFYARPSAPQSALNTPHSALRIPHYSFSCSGVVSPIHHPARAPLGRSLIPPLLVRRLGHDRRDLRPPALVIEPDVGDAAGGGLPPLAPVHGLPDDLDPHFHPAPAGGVDPRVGAQQLAPVAPRLEVT